MEWFSWSPLLLSVILLMMSSSCATHPRRHFNLCRFVPTDEELQEIIDGQEDLNDGGNVNEYSHKVIKIKKFSPRENVLISILEQEDEAPQEYLYLAQAVLPSVSILEQEDEAPQEYLYLAQAVLPSGKPVGHFKTNDEYLPMRKCGERQVFYNDEDVEIPGDELLKGGVTFEWIAPGTKTKGPVTVLVTKINMNLLHRHQYEETEQQKTEPTD